MPPEIADSDAESDLDSPVRRPAVHEPGKENPLPSVASLPAIDFDEYLDPTQKLSSSVSHYLSDFNQLDGSTDIAVARTADLQTTTLFGEILPGMRAKKRAHSALQDSLGEVQHQQPPENPKVKRSKTYGAASRSRTGQDDNLFAPASEWVPKPRDLEPADQDRDTVDQTVTDTRTTPANLNMPVSTGISNHTGVFPLLERSLADSSHCMTTSVATMGQYQSINIDFRGSGNGLNVNTNPFGSLSQVSFVEEPSQAKLEQIMDLIEVDGAKSTDIGANYHVVSAHESWQDQSLQILSQSSPPRPLAIDAARTRKDGAATYADGDNHFHVPEIANDIPDPANAAEDMTLSLEKASVPRKRGRKAKSSRLSSQSPAPSVNEDLDNMDFSVLANPTRARRGTIESLSQASQISATNAPSKKGKRRKSTQIDEEEAGGGAGESPLLERPTSDLNLSDEVVIGLPKEAYKPRPSRSRSKAIVEDETGQETTESSPVKQPTSDLNLSDEAVIGLPKEAYKPRPSRTRSKKFVDEDESLLVPLGADDEHCTSAKSNSNNSLEQDIPIITVAKSSSKKGRKSKVKRAKTSAAALLKKTDPMLSDGEKDVVWMDSKPAPVKLDLPPDLKALKKDPDAPKSKQDNEYRQESEQVKSSKSTSITIEIPSRPEVKDPVAEPKRRGRKPKKTGPQQQEQKTNEEVEEEQESCSKGRSPLAEKSKNILSAADKNLTEKTSTKAPTVSPITSPEPETDKHAQPEEKGASSGEGKRNEPITTPAKSKPAAPLSSTEKGPTKHSPINPPSLTGSGKKIIYRIGLSRRQNIPSLLRKVDRAKPPPKNVVRKEKESKKKKDADADYEGEDGVEGPGEMRGPDGMLIEWEF